MNRDRPIQDTLYLMGMMDEFEAGREWIEQKFDMNKMSGDVSVFETNIRYLGGFLALFALTGDALFREKAKETADKLLPAFNSPTGKVDVVVVEPRFLRRWKWNFIRLPHSRHSLRPRQHEERGKW